MRSSNGRLRCLAVISALALVALTGACGGGDDADGGAGGGSEAASEASGGGGGSITVEAKDFEFDPAELEVAAGAVTVDIDNAGEAPHTFTIEELDVNEEIDAGQQGTAEFDAEPGEYEFVCTFHLGQDMVGTLTVAE